MNWIFWACLSTLIAVALWMIGYAVGYHDGRRMNALDQATIDQLARTLTTRHTNQR